MEDSASYPNMTAFHNIMLLSCGAPLMPAGGSCINRLKSLINLFLAGVDIPGCPCTTHTPQREPKDRTHLSPIRHRPAPARAGLTTRTKFGGKNTAVTTSTTERTNPQQNWWIGASIPARTIGINKSHTERILQSFT